MFALHVFKLPLKTLPVRTTRKPRRPSAMRPFEYVLQQKSWIRLTARGARAGQSPASLITSASSTKFDCFIAGWIAAGAQHFATTVYHKKPMRPMRILPHAMMSPGLSLSATTHRPPARSVVSKFSSGILTDSQPQAAVVTQNAPNGARFA